MAWNERREVVEEFQNVIEARNRVMRHEAAREKFGGRFRGTERLQPVLRAVVEHENSVQRETVGFGDAGVAVPRRAVHPDAIAFCAQDDAVVAQYARLTIARPHARGSALARSRMTREQKTS